MTEDAKKFLDKYFDLGDIEFDEPIGAIVHLSEWNSKKEGTFSLVIEGTLVLSKDGKHKVYHTDLPDQGRLVINERTLLPDIPEELGTGYIDIENVNLCEIECVDTINNTICYKTTLGRLWI